MYSILNKSSGKGIAWECIKCGMPIFALLYLILQLLLTPITDLISHHPCPTLKARYQITSSPPPTTAASSPIVQDPNEARTKTAKAVLNHLLRILIMNCQSIKNKKAELHTIIDSAKPDIILGNEFCLTPDIKNSEIFPESFDAVPKDRVSDAHGGVFVAFKRDLLCTETRKLDTNCEIVWCKLNTIGSSTLYLGSFYRPPDKIDNDYLEEFIISLGRIMSNRNAHVLIGGDFNCGDIEWSTMQVPHGVQKRQTQQQLLDNIGEHCLTQVVNIPTRLDETLDLLFTNFHPL